MEWLVLLLFAALAAAFIGIGLPLRGRRGDDATDATDRLREEHGRLLTDLRELDDDAASGRVSAEDRRAGRRALAPRLRTVTEALREAGDEPALPH